MVIPYTVDLHAVLQESFTKRKGRASDQETAVPRKTMIGSEKMANEAHQLLIDKIQTDLEWISSYCGVDLRYV
jgi:hypothetical protein